MSQESKGFGQRSFRRSRLSRTWPPRGFHHYPAL